MALKRIPSNVESLISASVFVSNYKKAIEELVYNSLDAESTSIAIRVFIQDSSIQILDNGNGIAKNNFKLLGHRYMSSYNESNFVPTKQKYGYRGLSLSSIIEISQEVTITSRTDNSVDTYAKTFVNGKKQVICKTNARPSKGTTVEIKGFLYNLHIQKKSINPVLEMEHIKTFLEHLSLVSCSVSFSLRDDSKNEIVLKIHKNRDIYQTFLSLFNIKKEDVQELQVEKHQYKIQGFIEKSDINIRKYHWIYINGRFVTQTKVHQIVKRYFHGSCNQKIITKTKKFQNHFKDENEFLNKRMPSYFLFITCPSFDIIYAPEKTLVEFKEWLEIDMLIDKLFKFYHGKLRVNLVSRKDICNDTEHNENDKDTRQQVKNIMQKILGNNLKKSKVSQIPNGIKGNHVKKKKKKKTKEFNKSQEAFKNVSNGKERIEVVNMAENYTNGLDTQELVKSKHNTIIKKDSKASRKNQKLLTCKMKRKPLQKKQYTKKDNQIDVFFTHDTVIRKFKEPTTSVKNRCALLFDNVQRLLKENKHEVCRNKEQDNTTLDSLPYQNNLVNPSSHSIVSKNYVTKTLSSPRNANEKVADSDEGIDFITTYDLLNPIHRSQQQLKTHLNEIETPHRQLQSNNFINTYTINESNKPKLTYESHLYRAQLVSKRQATRQFISTPSCNNFLSQRDYNFISSNDKRLKKGKENRKKFSFNCQKYLKLNDNIIRNTNFTVDQSFHFDVSSSEKADQKFGSYYTDDILMSRNSLKTQPPLNSTRYRYHFNIESTYNIEHLISSPDQIMDYAEYDWQKTYSIQMSNDINYCEQRKETEQVIESKDSINVSNNNINIVFVSDHQNSKNSVSGSINPLRVCETVYRSNEVQSFENEFEFSFVDKNIKDSLFDYDYTKHFSNELVQNHVKEVSQYFTKDTGDNNLTNNSIYIHRYENLIHSETRKNEMEKAGTVYEPHKKHTENNNVDVDINTDNFELKSRYKFVPKGMSPVMVNNFTEINNENHEEEYYEDQIYRNFAKDIQIYSEILEPRVQNINDFTTREFEKVTCKINKANTDWIFDAESLRVAKVVPSFLNTYCRRVLGQVDCKFIASKVIGKSAKNNKSYEFLVLFDQHAVDERIRLENNLRDYTDGHVWKSISLDPIVLQLSKDNLLYLHNYREKFARFGLLWTVQNGNILINSIPKAILGQSPRHVEIIIKAVKCLISEQIEAIKSLKGNVWLYPKSIMDLVFSEACRYAIKFGDKLTKNECQNMLSSLAECKVPFQCAHGRPVMAVMMEIPKSNHNYKVNSIAIMRFQMSLK